MTKSLREVGMEEIFLKIIRDTYGKSTENMILDDEKLKCYLKGQRTTLSTLIQHSIKKNVV